MLYPDGKIAHSSAGSDIQQEGGYKSLWEEKHAVQMLFLAVGLQNR
jgi:hypothetical protein